MLDNFNNLLKKIILEQAGNEDSDRKRIIDTYNTNEFYIKFIQPIAEESNVIATKQRNNTYLVYGSVSSVCDFFSKFKVDETFAEDPKEFKIYSPLVTVGDEVAKLKLDQFYPIYNLEKYGVPTTHELENITGNVIEGHWYSLRDPNKPEFSVKGMKPTDIASSFKKIFTKKASDSIIIYVEFQINVENLKNSLWDDMTEYAKTPDEMNEYHNKESENFDYSKMNVKNEADEDNIKASLKDIKRSSKEYKENKI